MKILSKQLEQVEKMYREQKDAAYKHVSLEKSYKKLQADLEESNTTLKRQKDEIRLLSQTVQQQKAVEEKMAKFRAQLSAMRTERDKAVKEATQLAVSNAALETQKAETDSVKAALHDCYEEIENLYDEVERLSASASKADEDTAGRMPDEAIGRSCTSRHKFHERPQEHASALDALKCLKDTAKDASWFRDDLDAIHRELLDVKCNLAQAADKAAADDRELHEMRRAKVELEKAIGAGESGKRPIENGETEQKLAAANKELESLRAMNSTLGTDRAELMIRLDASEQDLKRTNSKLDALRKTLPLAAAAPHSLSALHSPLAPYAPSVTIAGESLEEEFKATKHKLAQEMHRTTTLQSEVGIYQEFLLLS